jgi:hypothetical protein
MRLVSTGADGCLVVVCVGANRPRGRITNRGGGPAGRNRESDPFNWREQSPILIRCPTADGGTDAFLPIYDAAIGDIDLAFEPIEAYLGKLNIGRAE